MQVIPDIIRVRALIFDIPGVQGQVFPRDRAEVAEWLLEPNSAVDLLPGRISVDKPCQIKAVDGRNQMEHRYYCQATVKMGKDGQWTEMNAACTSVLAGRHAYLRHVRDVHLDAGRSGRILDWAWANRGAVIPRTATAEGVNQGDTDPRDANPSGTNPGDVKPEDAESENAAPEK